VLIDDLGHLRTHATLMGVVERLDQGLIAAGSVIAIARTADDAGPLLAAPGRHLVGLVADPDDQQRLGGPPDGTPGRCHLLETGEIVQLALLDRPFESAVPDRLADGGGGPR
jgi:hypothetical protein